MIAWPVLIAVVSLVVWFLFPTSKAAQIAWVLFCVGAFWAVGMTCGDAFDVRRFFAAA